MLKKVMQTIEENRLFASGDTVVVAVSGGADSVALLDLLTSLKELRLRILVAHMNHRLRGEESDGDEAFVRELAARYGVSFVTQAVDIRSFSRERKLSLEEAGRVARYRFFNEIALSCNANAVALAHHADDQAETVLLRLLRGAGGSGLSAMAPKSGNYVRPLLAVTRKEVEAYLRSRGLAYREDKSNGDINFLRNRIRHELLPQLKSYNPAVAERLVATAELLTEDEVLLGRLTDVAFSRHGAMVEEEVSLNALGVASEPPGLRYRLYRKALHYVKGDLLRIGHSHVTDIDRLLRSPRVGGRISLPGGVAVVKRYGKLTFSRVDDLPGRKSFELLIEGPGSYALPGGVLTLEQSGVPEQFKQPSRSVAYLDGGAFPFPWLVRSSRPGDRLVPMGMTGRKKVKEIFIDEKVPAQLRPLVPVLVSGDSLLWLAGLRIADKAKITAATTTAIRVEFQRVSGKGRVS